jgi:hypothetical protein
LDLERGGKRHGIGRERGEEENKVFGSRKTQPIVPLYYV